MIENIAEFIENRTLLDKVIGKIREHGFEEIKIYKSDRIYDSNAICFYLTPQEGTEEPFIKAFDLNEALESGEFLGCHVELTVNTKKNPSERVQKIIDNSISILDLDDSLKQNLIKLYSEIKLGPRPPESVINREPFFYPQIPSSKSPPMPHILKEKNVSSEKENSIKNNENNKFGESKGIFLNSAEKRKCKEEELEKRNKIKRKIVNLIRSDPDDSKYVENHLDLFDDLKFSFVQKNTSEVKI